MSADRDNAIRDKGELHTLYGLQDIISVFSNLLDSCIGMKYLKYTKLIQKPLYHVV